MILYSLISRLLKESPKDGSFNLKNVANAIKFSQKSPSTIVKAYIYHICNYVFVNKRQFFVIISIFSINLL